MSSPLRLCCSGINIIHKKYIIFCCNYELLTPVKQKYQLLELYEKNNLLKEIDIATSSKLHFPVINKIVELKKN